MSSRRGSRPANHLPHGEELRRSSRERQMKYLNLSEDLIIHESEQVQHFYSRRFGSRSNNSTARSASFIMEEIMNMNELVF